MMRLMFQIHPSQGSQAGSDPDVLYATIVLNQHVAAQKVNQTRKTNFV